MIKKIKWAGPLGFAGVGSNPDVAGQVSGTPAKRKEFGVCRTYFQGAGYALRDYFGKKEVNYLQKQKLHRSLKLSYVCGSLETQSNKRCISTVNGEEPIWVVIRANHSSVQTP